MEQSPLEIQYSSITLLKDERAFVSEWTGHPRGVRMMARSIRTDASFSKGGKATESVMKCFPQWFDARP